MTPPGTSETERFRSINNAVILSEQQRAEGSTHFVDIYSKIGASPHVYCVIARSPERATWQSPGTIAISAQQYIRCSGRLPRAYGPRNNMLTVR